MWLQLVREGQQGPGDMQQCASNIRVGRLQESQSHSAEKYHSSWKCVHENGESCVCVCFFNDLYTVIFY